MLINYLEQQCLLIHSISPKTKIFLSPLLPTKNAALNIKVREYNHYLRTLSNKDQRLNLISYRDSIFANESGILKPDMGCFDKKNNCPHMMAKIGVH